MPISGKKMISLFEAAGWREKRRSKKHGTSHVVMTKEGYGIVVIPLHDELKKGLECTLRKILNK